jgi:NAD(P)-dependent dehydrogenase (short-subunit alcohol dehydrogenase family)
MRLQDKTAIVTGAASGIGWATVQSFLAEGARVSLFDVNAARAQQLVDTLPDAQRPRTSIHTVNVADEAAVSEACEAAVTAFGDTQILINCAATQTPAATIDQLSPQDWNEALNVNLTGTFLVSRAVIPAMRRAGGGAIVHTASQLGSVAMPGFSAYCATKGAILQLTKAMALDHARDNIRVNSISPGATLTERLRTRFGSDQGAFDALGAGYPMGRLAEAGEVAAGILYLASDEASFVNGTELVIDGGYLAQ